MKGHMQDGKFHPHTEHKGVSRKSRTRNAKVDGVKIRFPQNKFRSLNDDELRELIKNNNKELGSAPRKQIPVDRNDPNSFLVDSDELLTEADDRKADETARAILELKDRGQKDLQKMRDEIDSDKIFKAISKFAQSSDFHTSEDHVWGFSEKDPKLPSYGEGVQFAQKTNEEYRFGRDGMGVLATIIGKDPLLQVLKDAKKENLVSKFTSVNAMLSDADIITSSEPNRPVIIKLTERERKRYYMVAPRISDVET